MTIVITHREKNKYTGKYKKIVSHGVNEDTGKTVILPNEPTQNIGSVFNLKIGEFVLLD